jgi:hypothetical protein
MEAGAARAMGFINRRIGGKISTIRLGFLKLLRNLMFTGKDKKLINNATDKGV